MYAPPVFCFASSRGSCKPPTFAISRSRILRDSIFIWRRVNRLEKTVVESFEVERKFTSAVSLVTVNGNQFCIDGSRID